jgi:hypothetical protein
VIPTDSIDLTDEDYAHLIAGLAPDHPDVAVDLARSWVEQVWRGTS